MTEPVETANQLLVRAHRMYQKMVRHPHLTDAMRKIFRSALMEKAAVDPEQIIQKGVNAMEVEQPSTTAGDLRDYADAALDLAMVRHFDDGEIDQYINLSRKEDRLRNLIKVVNKEGVTSLGIKKALQEFCEIPEGNTFVPPSDSEGVRVALINHFISNQIPFLGIAKQHITIRDIHEMVEHSSWSPRHPGRIGGKAAGLLLAYRIVLPRLSDRDPELERYVAIPESYYFNSGIFSDFLHHNDLYELHTHKYKTHDDIASAYKEIPKHFQKATFPNDTSEIFRKFLQEMGEHPLILRSSSLLEDNFGHAFSGKYDSVFISNQGSLEQRLKEFTAGLKLVLMSTYGPAPILYRKERKLLDFDERMSVLVQKVVGRRFGDYFFPFAAGVAFSFNGYGWTPRIRQKEGLIRLVMGLGTRAVERVGDDYPRMIPISHPLLRPEVDASQIQKYSQKMVDLLNLKTKQLESVPFFDLANRIDHPDLYYAVSMNQDGNMTAPMFKDARFDLRRSCLTFQNFLTKTRFMSIMKKILKKLEKAYGRPVDVEFAWDGDRFYLLQCRTLSLRTQGDTVSLPEDIDEDRTLFTNNRGITNGVVRNIEYVVYVDPRAYDGISDYEEKIAVGRLVGRINRLLEGKRYALLGPGRWGSNDINLGVRVGYEDINNTLVLGEIAFATNGSRPEVSYGTHFFNDLVEADIIPIAIYPEEKGTFINERFLLLAPNELSKTVPDMARHEDVVHLIHMPSAADGNLLHIYQDAQNQEGIGFSAPPA